MSKIPYVSAKVVKKAKEKFMKELKKDKASEYVFNRELDKEEEISGSNKELDTEIDEELEFEVLEEADEAIPSTQDTEEAEDTEEVEDIEEAEEDDAIESTEQTESGDSEQW